MKKIIAIIIVLLLVTGLSIGAFFLFTNSKKEFDDTTNPKYVFDGKFSETKINDEKSALIALENVKNNLGIIDINNELKSLKSNEFNGNKFFTFDQYYNGIRVYGNSILVTTKGNNADYITSTTEFIPKKLVSEEFKHSIEDVYKYLKDKVIDESIVNSDTFKIDGEKIYYKKDNKYLNCYLVNATNTKVTYNYSFIVDDNLNLINETDNTKYYEKSLSLEKDGNKINVITEDYIDYKLIDKARNIKYHFYDGNNYHAVESNVSNYGNYQYTFKDINDADEYMLKANNIISKVYDFYSNVLNYHGVDNKKSELDVFLGAKRLAPEIREVDGNDYNNIKNNSVYSNVGIYNNILITDGYQTNGYLDNYMVLGHEYTHGVFKHITSGKDDIVTQGISEGYADVMALIINGYYNGEYDFNFERNAIEKSKTCKKCLYNTSKISYDLNDPHLLATILSHAMYLMTQGDNSITDFEKMAKLWFDSMYYLPSLPDYGDVYNALLKSADNNSFTEKEKKKIIESFNNVGVQSVTPVHTISNLTDFQCAQSRCEMLQENGLVNFYDKNGNGITPEKIIIYKYENRDISNPNKVKEINPNNNYYEFNLEPNNILEERMNSYNLQSTDGYILEAYYKNNMEKVYLQICSKDSKSANFICGKNINMYFGSVISEENNEKNNQKEESNYSLVCDMSMDSMISNFAEPNIAKLIKSLDAKVIVDYEDKDMKNIKETTLSMIFTVDLSSITSNSEDFEKLRTEVYNNICKNNNYKTCDTIRKGNTYSVFATDTISNLLSYKNSDTSVDLVKAFIEKRGFKCSK